MLVQLGEGLEDELVVHALRAVTSDLGDLFLLVNRHLRLFGAVGLVVTIMSLEDVLVSAVLLKFLTDPAVLESHPIRAYLEPGRLFPIVV